MRFNKEQKKVEVVRARSTMKRLTLKEQEAVAGGPGSGSSNCTSNSSNTGGIC